MDNTEKILGDIADIKISISKLTDILDKLDTQIKTDLETLTTKVEALPTASVKDDVTNIIGKIDNIPTNNGLRDIEKSLNDVVVTKLNLTHDSVKEIPTNNSLDSLESKLNNLYDRINQSNIDSKENLRSHISWNREQANGHVNWRVDRLRKEEFNKLVELICYALSEH